MVNFGSPDTIPERYRGRKLHVHNPQVTLMRTTAEENERIGRWIGERLNANGRAGAVLFCLKAASRARPPGNHFWDPEADAALFRARSIGRYARPGNRQAHPTEVPHQRTRIRGGDRRRVPLVDRTHSTRRRVVEVIDAPI